MSSRNALKHGILARRFLLPDESRISFVKFARRLRRELQPQGVLEEMLVERIVSAAWRVRRVLAAESESIEFHRVGLEDEDRGLGWAFIKDGRDSAVFSRLSRYEAMLERSIYRALGELERRRSRRSGARIEPPREPTT